MNPDDLNHGAEGSPAYPNRGTRQEAIDRYTRSGLETPVSGDHTRIAGYGRDWFQNNLEVRP